MSHISRVLMIESGSYCHLQRWYRYIIPGSCPCSLPNRLRAVFSFFARSEEVNRKVISILVTWQLTPMLLSTLLLAPARRRLPGDCAQSYFRISSWNPYIAEKLSFLFFPQYLLFSQPAIVVIGLANPTSISVFEDFIYWVEENSIERANKEVRSPGQPNRGMELKNANDTVKSLKVVSGNIQKGEFLIKLVTNLRYFS